MAKVKGPLFSFEASGKIGDALVYSKWKGAYYVRQHFIPANPQSDAQVYVRGCMANANTEWDAKDEEGKAAYDTLAEGTGMSGFNLYVQEYMKLYV